MNKRELRQGREELEKIADYLKHDITLREINNRTVIDFSYDEESIAKTAVTEVRNILDFSKTLESYIKSTENHQAVISSIIQVALSLKNRLAEGRKLPNYFLPAYKIVNSALPRSVEPLERLEIKKPAELIQIADELEKKVRQFTPGKFILIDGIRQLRNLALREDLGQIFQYTGDIYCTTYPQTQQFKEDLMRAKNLI